jgi:hypothetical protein
MEKALMWETHPNNHIELGLPLGGIDSFRIVFQRGGSDVAYVVPTLEDNGNANARLIAYAPALLDACQRMWKEAKGSKGYVPEPVFQAARLCRMAAYVATLKASK